MCQLHAYNTRGHYQTRISGALWCNRSTSWVTVLPLKITFLLLFLKILLVYNVSHIKTWCSQYIQESLWNAWSFTPNLNVTYIHECTNFTQTSSEVSSAVRSASVDQLRHCAASMMLAQLLFSSYILLPSGIGAFLRLSCLFPHISWMLRFSHLSNHHRQLSFQITGKLCPG